MMLERTLILVKPDGVEHGHIGAVINRIERRGYKLEALQMIQATDEQLAQHYADKVDKPYFPALVEYMERTPLVAMVVSGVNVIQAFRTMAGVTNPTEALPGTIRGDFGAEVTGDGIENVVHSSDCVTNAEKEIKVWFGNLD
ncbi:nucleoside-diphosphate kinase [Weissella muntiaci]|uniref:Nucleoside diphosphate kinase n=2 Tax=Weissella muntiaci TaxID=2508881 RepID=A0A6C2C8P0_9LACO|nr:nucleoside-diphosphate kinase [Weissella muntiaci]TYC49956.1 nucleoside-diphosphate kinase [Weissella muntiaci]